MQAYHPANNLQSMSTFYFQRFAVRQEHAGMKVCTDATLFGAMAPVRGGETVLDIGTGTGLLALMAAQLGAGSVTGVEMTAEACAEARHNFAQSPWAECLQAVHRDIQGFARESRRTYDLVIANPPFFDRHSRSAASLRNAARHTDSLPFPDLIEAVQRLLAERGLFYLLIPSHAVETLTHAAAQAGLHLVRHTEIRGLDHKPARLAALTFSRAAAPLRSDSITIYREKGIYTAQSEDYLRPFLLRFAE